MIEYHNSVMKMIVEKCMRRI